MKIENGPSSEITFTGKCKTCNSIVTFDKWELSTICRDMYGNIERGWTTCPSCESDLEVFKNV